MLDRQSAQINPTPGGTPAEDRTLSRPVIAPSLGFKTFSVLSHLHRKPVQKSNFLENKNLNILPSISVSKI